MTINDTIKEEKPRDAMPPSDSDDTVSTTACASDISAQSSIQHSIHDTQNKPSSEANHHTIATLKETNDHLTKEVAHWRDQTLRAIAEGENKHKRLQKDIHDAERYAIAKFAKDMLDVCDNLQRTRQHITDEMLTTHHELRHLVEGVDMVQRTIESSFLRHGLERVSPQTGDAFDHHRHEAIAHIPTEEVAPGCVVACVRDGYVLYERVLRTAMVSVARAHDAS